MENVMIYICKHMHVVENDINKIAKILFRQNKMNKAVAAFSVLTTLHICKLHNRIDILAKEVEELKETKGD